MQISMNLDLMHSNYVFARISKCEILGPSKTFAGFEFTFNLHIEPTDIIKEKGAELRKLVVDVSLSDGSNTYIGRLKDRFITPSTINYAKDHQQQLQLDGDIFWKLVDETHYKELELKLRAQAVVHVSDLIRNSSGGTLSDPGLVFLLGEAHAIFPHSEWHKILNNTHAERFDLISLRTVLPAIPGSTIFTQAFDKLHEARNKFNRGDWNAVGAACRSAIRTIMSVAHGKKKPMDHLLASVIGDPKRKKFASSIIAIWDALNTATHQEGSLNDDLPPADFQREDALLCLHITAAAISYISSVYTEKGTEVAK